MNVEDTAPLDSESLEALKRFAPRLASRAQRIVEAISTYEQLLEEASGEAERRDIAFRFVAYNEEAKAIGVLLEIPDDRRRASLTIDAGLDGEEADAALVTVIAMKSARRLRRSLMWSAAKWYPPRAHVVFVSGKGDHAATGTLTRLLKQKLFREVETWDLTDPIPILPYFDVLVFLLTPKLANPGLLKLLLGIADKPQSNRGDALVVPVVVRPTDSWQETALGELKPIPDDGSAISLAEDLEAAWREMLLELGRRIRAWLAPPEESQSSAPQVELGRRSSASGGLVPEIASRSALVVTSQLDQYRAVRSHLERLHENTCSDGTVFEVGRFARGAWNVALLEVDVSAPDRSRAAIKSAVQACSPELLVSIGCAGGLLRVSIGDILVASRAYRYSADANSLTIELDPHFWSVPYRLEQRARAEARKSDWLKRLPTSQIDRTPAVWIGALALTDRRVSHAEMLRASGVVCETWQDVVAIDLTTDPFFEAFSASGVAETLIVRGISDMVRSSDRRSLPDEATRHAAAFTMDLISKI